MRSRPALGSARHGVEERNAAAAERGQGGDLRAHRPGADDGDRLDLAVDIVLSQAVAHACALHLSIAIRTVERRMHRHLASLP